MTTVRTLVCASACCIGEAHHVAATLALVLLGCSADGTRPVEPESAASATVSAQTPGPVATEAASVSAAATAAPTVDAEPGVSVPSAYAKYCTGTLKTERKVRLATFTGNWMHRGETAPAGTVFLLDTTNGAYGAGYGGFLRIPDGTWAEIMKDADEPFTRDVHFTSSCAPPEPPSIEKGKAVRVLIGKATFFANKESTGKPCVLPPATELSVWGSYDWLGGGLPVGIGYKPVKAVCGWEPGYSKDFHSGELFLK